MTPEEVARVTATADRVRGDHELAAAFYALLFARHPELRRLFPESMGHQFDRFVTELEALAIALPGLPGFETRARELGERHVAYGVRREHFALVREALLDAMSDRLPGFGAEERRAWAKAFNLLTEIMLEAADAVSAVEEPGAAT